MAIVLENTSIYGITSLAGASNTAITFETGGIVNYPNRPCFFAHNSDNNQSATSTGVALVFNTTKVNNGGGFDTSTGRFTVPAGANGIWEFHAQLLYRDSGGNIEWSFYKNGGNLNSRGVVYANQAASYSPHIPMHSTMMLDLAVGDVIDVRMTTCASGVNAYYGGGLGHFAGWLIG